MERMPKAMVKMSWILLFIVMTFQHFKTIDAIKYRGDKCSTKGRDGECKEWSQCPTIKTLIENGEYTTQEVIRCGFTVYEEVICCPIEKWGFAFPNTTPSQRSNSGERPAARACRRIEQGLPASVSTRILGGTPAELSEFPHMVALIYSPIGRNNRERNRICGGSLIDKRFVLTAAHCVAIPEKAPSRVRLGVVDFNDTKQMNNAVELRIKKTFIHDGYTGKFDYNDIAILELEREVETNEYIYPVCLYMNKADPDPKIKLWVTGWGVTNIKNLSNILLKTSLHTVPLENCNTSYVEYGLTRKIPKGIIPTQLCAGDKDQMKDSCKGDSGGPLMLVVDESLKNYRVVGIVSSGFGCGSSIPGVYTRVAAYLDFIERIVWPNGGD